MSGGLTRSALTVAAHLTAGAFGAIATPRTVLGLGKGFDTQHAADDNK
jgi:hypothetical protein